MKKFSKLFSKKVAILSTITISIFIMIAFVTVNASTYHSTLSIGNGSSFTGPSRYYTAGNNKIYIGVDTWTDMNNYGYTKLGITLAKDTGTTSVLQGYQIMQISHSNVTYSEDFGKLDASYKYYAFSTRIDSKNYGGITSNYVEMTSDY